MSTEQIFLDLEAGSEWRFELEADETIAVRPFLTHSANSTWVNSAEMPLATWYPLHRHLKSSIYSPSSSRIEVTSMPASQYVSSSSTTPTLTSLHLALEAQRIRAKRHLSSTSKSAGPSAPPGEQVTRGPRVMVLGPPSSGKTTVVKNLVNMALSSGMGWSVGVAGLDPASPSNLIPGSLSLSTPTHPIPTHHLAHPFGSPPVSVPPSTMSADVGTLGWWYGHLEPTTKGSDVWRKLVTSMGEAWKARCEKDANVMASGLIMDTSSAFVAATLGTKKDDPKARYSLVAHAIEAFQIDTVLVIGHEKLTIDLLRLLPSLRILRIPKSSGTVDQDDAYREIVDSWAIRSYFYGEPEVPKAITSLLGRAMPREMSLTPYSFQLGWETLTVLRVGEMNAAPSTALPLGSSRTLSPTRLSRVDPEGPAHVVRLLNTVLAVVALRPGDRIKKEATGTAAVKDEVKEEVKTEVKTESGEGQKQDGAPGETTAADGGEEGEEEAEDEGEGAIDDDDDEVPFIEDIGWREVAGFIVITSIDTQKRKYTILSPSPGKLPSTVAIAGAIDWVDSA